MSQLEWYRTFVAIYRAGTVSGAAKARHLTHPAASQQLAALEDAVGAPLFVRTPRGVQATPRGQTLYHQVFDAVDRLERVSRGLRGREDAADRPARLGAPAEYFHAFALERLRPTGRAFVVRFGDDRDLLARVEAGELDAAVTTLPPAARALQHRALAAKHFALVGPPDLAPPAPDLAPEALGAWLNGHAWVSYSEELPTTRRFWQQHLRTRFDARLALVVPDLRSVLRAVELGFGLSLLPEFLCRDALAAGRVRHVWPVRDLVRGERWVWSQRAADGDREDLARLAEVLTDWDDPAS